VVTRDRAFARNGLVPPGDLTAPLDLA